MYRRCQSSTQAFILQEQKKKRFVPFKRKREPQKELTKHFHAFGAKAAG